MEKNKTAIRSEVVSTTVNRSAVPQCGTERVVLVTLNVNDDDDTVLLPTYMK